MNCFCGMVDRRKTFSRIPNRDHCQKFSQSEISNMLRARFELAQNLSSDFVEGSCVVVAPLHHGDGLNLNTCYFRGYARARALQDTFCESGKRLTCRDSPCRTYRGLQLFTWCLRLSLVFVWNNTQRKSLISVFQEFFASINKMFILVGGLGTRLSFYGA